MAPVELSDPKKLMYSVHLHGPDEEMPEYFMDHHFPHNLPAIWEPHFGFVPTLTGRPIIFGAVGGPEQRAERRAGPPVVADGRDALLLEQRAAAEARDGAALDDLAPAGRAEPRRQREQHVPPELAAREERVAARERPRAAGLADCLLYTSPSPRD